MSADPYSIEHMWYNRSLNPEKPYYICKRGCSNTEGGHPYMHASLPGSNYSPALAGALLDCRLAEANVRAGARNNGNPGVTLNDAYEQHCKLAVAKRYGWQEQYEVPHSIPVPDTTTEQFGVDYKPLEHDVAQAVQEQKEGRATATEQLTDIEEHLLTQIGAIEGSLPGFPLSCTAC